ncbi:unnamed protein product [Sphagnum tenellum]|jgi:hypothetical protein
MARSFWEAGNPVAVGGILVGAGLVVVGSWIVVAKFMQAREETRCIQEAQEILINGKTMFKFPKSSSSSQKRLPGDQVNASSPV